MCTIAFSKWVNPLGDFYKQKDDGQQILSLFNLSSNIRIFTKMRYIIHLNLCTRAIDLKVHKTFDGHK